MAKSILLSFDVEEFDVPLEYGEEIDLSTQFKVSLAGLRNVLSLLDNLQVQATFFTTANFAIEHPEITQKIAQKNEIASHGFYHSQFTTEDLSKSKRALETIIKTQVIGFRMARLQPVNDWDILEAGYRYNSSMNPTYLPGRYNNFFKPRTAYYSHQLLNIPTSVTPLIRFPLFWLSFKNFPLSIIKPASKITLEVDNYLNLYFHPWEFTTISRFRLPNYIKKLSGMPMLEKLEKYLVWLKRQGEFVTIKDWIRQSFN